MFTALSLLLSKIRSEPALVVTLLAAVVEALQAEDVLTWQTFGTVVAGVILRQLVTPTNRVAPLIDQAADEAYLLGLAQPAPPEAPGDFE